MWNRSRSAAATGSVVAILGSVLPWWYLSHPEVEETLWGFDRAGRYVMAFAVVSLIVSVFYWNRSGTFVTQICGLLIVSIGLVVASDPFSGAELPAAVRSHGPTFRESLTRGIGIYSTVVGGTIVVLASVSTLLSDLRTSLAIGSSGSE